MILNIPDNISPKERRRRLLVDPCVYAIEKFNGNKSAAGRWLGISERGMRYRVFNLPELERYREPDPVDRDKDEPLSPVGYSTIQELLKGGL